MALFNAPHARDTHNQLIQVSEQRVVPYAFADIQTYLRDTSDILPHSFTGASVEYPSPELNLDDILQIHLSALIRHDFPACVTELDMSAEGMRTTISVNEADFAIASLRVLIAPDHRDSRRKTFARGDIAIEQHHLPVPTMLIKPVAKRAIGSFLNTAVRNIETQLKK